jgi:hypothetical protein
MNDADEATNDYLMEKSRQVNHQAFEDFKVERAKRDSEFAQAGRANSGMHQNYVNDARKDCLRGALEDIAQVALIKTEPKAASDIVAYAGKRLCNSLLQDFEATLFARSAMTGGMGEAERQKAVGKLDEEFQIITMGLVTDTEKCIVGTDEVSQPEKASTALSRISEGISINLGSAALIGLFGLLTLGLGAAIVALVWKVIVG